MSSRRVFVACWAGGSFFTFMERMLSLLHVKEEGSFFLGGMGLNRSGFGRNVCINTFETVCLSHYN